MTEFRVTWGQQYRHEPHPSLGVAHPDGWMTIVAASTAIARNVAFAFCGPYWCSLEPANDPDLDWSIYPLGEVYRVDVAARATSARYVARQRKVGAHERWDVYDTFECVWPESVAGFGFLLCNHPDRASAQREADELNEYAASPAAVRVDNVRWEKEAR